MEAAGYAVVAGAGRIFSGEGTSSVSAASSRIGDGPRFTGEIWEAISSGGHHSNGTAMWYALQSVVPRILMPEKGVTVPLDVYTERELDLAVSDGCLTSYGYAFMEGGWPAVFILHILLGLGLALVSRKAMAGFSPLFWLACAFSWEVALQMENELISEGLSAVRCIAIYAVIVQLYSMAVRRGRRTTASGLRDVTVPLLPSHEGGGHGLHAHQTGLLRVSQ